MIKKIIFTLIITIIGVVQPALAQRKASKSADVAFERKQYNVAIERYKKAYKKTGKKKQQDERDYITYQLAECYRLTESTKLAESHYKRLLKTDLPKNNPTIYLHYANSLKRNKKYEEAAEYYTIYNELVPEDPRGVAALEDIQHIQVWQETPTKYEVTRLKKLNSKASEFGIAWVSNNYNEVIFSSTREGGVSKEKDAITGQHFADFYTSRQNKQGEWEEVTLADEENINSEGSEGTPFMNKNFSAMYFTRCPNHKKRASGCQIMRATRSGSAWDEPVTVEIKTIDSLDVVGHPTVSSNELTLIFASERKNGIGGKDLWISERESTSEKFGRPRNLSEIVNTEGDELYPYLRNDSTLYFASDGHGGMGGLDIFVTTLDASGEWAVPTNLKHPFNSIGNDYGITFHPNEERGFFVSNRESKNNGLDDDIYYFILPPVLFTLNGTVKNINSLQFVEGADVKITSSDGTKYTTKSSNQGTFMFTNSQIKHNKTYILTINKKNYFLFTDTISTEGFETSQDFNKDYLISVIPDNPVVLPDILYDLAKWELQPQFEDSLKGLIEMLQVNPNITIELGSHTDNRDSHESNDILSQKRAQSVCDFLVIRGIDPYRLTAKGYGERAPRTLQKNYTYKGFTLNSGTTLTEEYIKSLPKDVQEFAHQLNRRTEFRVISKDYVPRENISDDQMANVYLRPEDNKIDIAVNKQGAITFKAIVNAYTENITYDKNFNGLAISQKKVMSLLNDGIITKDDFIGDNIDRIIKTGAVADRAQLLIREIRIADRSVNNVKVTVYNSLKTDWLMGQGTLKEFGEFEFDTNSMKLIFNKEK